MIDWKKYFKDDDIFFITPDVKRGLGLSGILPNYHIICSNFDPIIPSLRKQGGKIFCLEELDQSAGFEINNSGRLLEQSKVSEYIKAHSRDTPKIIYFKPSVKLDYLIKARKYFSLGNSSQLNELFENKIKFYQILKKSIPEAAIPSGQGVLRKLNFKALAGKFSLPLVVQFGHGWAGKTTFFIEDEKEFMVIIKKFPQTRVKVSKYISGFTVLNNCCIYQNKVLVGLPAIQLDGIRELDDKPWVTCGRQWPVKFLIKEQIDLIYNYSQLTGKLMNKAGFKGFFGIDFLITDKTGKIYISEVNARLTASAPFYTRLEIGNGAMPLLGYHIASFLGESIPADKHAQAIYGSQIIFRNPQKLPKIDSQIDFAVFDSSNQIKIKPVRVEYFPERLTQTEFIYMKKILSKRGDGDEELVRIETKREVLEKPHRLSSWLRNIIY